MCSSHENWAVKPLRPYFFSIQFLWVQERGMVFIQASIQGNWYYSIWYLINRCLLIENGIFPLIQKLTSFPVQVWNAHGYIFQDRMKRGLQYTTTQPKLSIVTTHLKFHEIKSCGMSSRRVDGLTGHVSPSVPNFFLLFFVLSLLSLCSLTCSFVFKCPVCPTLDVKVYSN